MLTRAQSRMLTEKVESAQRAVDWIVEKHNTIEPVTFGNKAEDDFFHGLTSESSRYVKHHARPIRLVKGQNLILS